MANHLSDHPIRTPIGLAAFVAWSLYVVIAIVHLPSVPFDVLIVGFFGTLACFAIALGFRRWLLLLLIAAFVHLSLYAAQVVGWASRLAAAEKSSFSSSLSFYYETSWKLIVHVFQNKGATEGLVQVFLDVVMPVVSLVVLVVGLLMLFAKPRVSQVS